MRFTRHSSLITRYALLIIALAILLGLIAAPLASLPASPIAASARSIRLTILAAASALGAGWTRVRFPWATLQPNNDGEWNDAFFTEAQLNAEIAAGREVVGLIVNTPPWALEDGNIPGVPSGL